MPMGVLEGGLSIRFMALQMGCVPATIINLRRFHKETDSANDRACPGRKRVTTAYYDSHIVLGQFRDEFCIAAQALAETLGANGGALVPFQSTNSCTQLTYNPKFPFFF